jgi:hypothetical protein
MKRALVVVVLALALASVMDGQPVLQRGDILMSHIDFETSVGKIVVFGRDGAFKGELISFPDLIFDLLYRDGIIYVAARPDRIERVAVQGDLLTPFTTDAFHANYLSPGPDGGLIAVSVSDLYQFSAAGARVRHRTDHLMDGGGIDLAPDGCTLFSNAGGSLRKWNACLDSPVTFLGVNHGAGGGSLRILADGSLLIDVIGGSGEVRRISAAGQLIRSYPAATGIALDIQRQSRHRNGDRVTRDVT